MTYHQTCAHACAALYLGLCAQAASAAESAAAGDAPAPAVPAVTANITLASQYVSRGIRQTWDKPALQGGLDYVHPSGLSAGTWASAISDKFVESATVEWDIYGGYSGAVGGVGYSAMLYVYRYPNAIYRATGTRYHYNEVSLGLTYRALYAKYNRTISRDFFGIPDARGTGYLDLGANVEVGGGHTLNLHYGDGRVAGAGNHIWDWKDGKVGLTKALEDGWSISGAYTRAKGATNAYDIYTLGIPNRSGAFDISNVARGTVVLSLTKVF
ncbi:choline dehydrogenase [Massilia sp. Root351]|jgi:uncharacterized protein (TIGR02001 family)|uniref:TorF family putative porin n=1 Tax=Massilia sp. Root351 TaxID=1736522 RepID=UPI00070F24F2|nr:TorF family putative porin [Massilia sp. Root351]KQV82313.1 choline dehydrogenase [Massilia sp. Root351]